MFIYQHKLKKTETFYMAGLRIFQVVMDNGIARVTLSKPDGIVTGIEYNGIDNLLEVLNEEVNRG